MAGIYSNARRLIANSATLFFALLSVTFPRPGLAIEKSTRSLAKSNTIGSESLRVDPISLLN